MPNTKLGDYFRNRPPRQTLTAHPLVNGVSRVGVEIELENIGNVRFQSGYWEVKQDGSLRNEGREFVFQGPTGGVDLFNAIVELDGYLFDKNPDGNWRCSTHVHLDVRDMTVKQLKTLILTYLMYEKVLFRLSGMHRYNNNFCCAIGFAQQQLQVLSEAWSSDTVNRFIDKILRGWDKYSALNLLPISNFGSVEFRLSGPVWRKGKLLLLCNRYLALKEFAMSWGGTDLELIDFLSKANPREVLGKGCPKELPKEIEDDLLVGLKLCYDLVVFSEDRVIPEFNKPHARTSVDLAWASGQIPVGLRDRVPLDLHRDGSPGVPLLSPNIRRYLRDRSAEHGLFLPEQLARFLTYSSVEWYANMFGVDATAILGDNYSIMYNEWVNAGRPLQEVPQIGEGGFNPLDGFIPPPAEPVMAVFDEDDDDDDDDDDDQGDW